MDELFRQYLFIFAFSMVKFVVGPIVGVSSGLSLLETVGFTVFGMMATVINLTLIGSDVRKRLIKRFAPNRKLFTRRNRRIVKVWRKYGVFGITFLTPVLFSPIVGTIIAVTFGERKSKIILYMLFAAVFWGVIITLLGRQFMGILEYYGMV